MGEFWEKLSSLMQDSFTISDNLIRSLIIIIILWFIRFVALKLIYRKSQSGEFQYKARKLVNYLTGFAGILLIGREWFRGFQELTTFLGLVSAGIAIALKDILTNFAAWLFIIWRQPFRTGDRVQIGDTAGDVIDIRIFQFTLLEVGNRIDAEQSTGRIVHIPNAMVFTSNLANYSTGFPFIWNEIEVLITFESNWKRAKEILHSIVTHSKIASKEDIQASLKQAAKKYLIFYRNLTPIIYTSVKDSGILLTIRYMARPKTIRSLENEIWENILLSFAKEEDINLAYNTMRIVSEK